MQVAVQKVTIFDAFVEVEMSHGMKKTLSIHDYVSSLTSTIGVDEKVTPMFLPSNTYLASHSQTSMIIGCYFAEAKREIQYKPRGAASLKKIPIVFPNIVISHQLKRVGDEWHLKQSQFFATNKSLGELPMEFITKADYSKGIWPVPFTNTYDSGNMCYGGNTMPFVFKDNFRGMDWYYQFLYSTPFNDDLGVRSLKKSMSPAAWYDYLGKQDKFPYDMLK